MWKFQSSPMGPPYSKSTRVVSKSTPRVTAALPPASSPVRLIRLMTAPGALDAKVDADPPRIACTLATV